MFAVSSRGLHQRLWKRTIRSSYFSTTSKQPEVEKEKEVEHFYVPFSDRHRKRVRNSTLGCLTAFSAIGAAEFYGYNMPPPEEVTLFTQFTSSSPIHYAGMAASLIWLVANYFDARITVSQMDIDKNNPKLLLIKVHTLLGNKSKNTFQFPLDHLQFSSYGTKPNCFFVRGTRPGNRRYFLFDRLEHIEQLFGVKRKAGMLPLPKDGVVIEGDEDAAPVAKKFVSRHAGKSRKRGF